MERCRWPPLGAPYDAALRETVAYVIDRYEQVGIVAAGTMVASNPGPRKA